MGKLIRNGIEYGGGNGTDIFEVTQAEYDALKQAGTLVRNALYVITDAPNLNATADDIEYQSGVTVKQAIDTKASISEVKELRLISQTFSLSANSSITIQANSTRIMCLLFGASDSEYVRSVAYLIGGYVTASRCTVTNLSGLTGVTINSSSTTDMKFVITNTQNFTVPIYIYNLIGAGFTLVT